MQVEGPSAAKKFVDTTVWPIEEVRSGCLLYVNDRSCPQNPNPLHTPKKSLEPGFNAGTSGLWKKYSRTIQTIDAVLPAALIAHRLTPLVDHGGCKKARMVEHARCRTHRWPPRDRRARCAARCVCMFVAN